MYIYEINAYDRINDEIDRIINDRFNLNPLYLFNEILLFVYSDCNPNCKTWKLIN